MEKRSEREAIGRAVFEEAIRGLNEEKRRMAQAKSANAGLDKEKPRLSCLDCVFCISSLTLWLRTLVLGLPVGGQCANHPDTPGQIRPIPRRPCRNFRGRPFRAEPPQPPNDRIRYIPLTRGLFAIVDAEDYEWLSRYKWSVQPSANHGTYYAKRGYRGRLVLMHREIMKPPRGMFVDHMNGNGLDNRRCNLRICTPEQNSCNRSKQRNARHKFIGVHPCGQDTYVAIVDHNGKRYREGPFDDEVEAARARDRLALQLHGPYARLNFPPEPSEDEGCGQ